MRCTHDNGLLDVGFVKGMDLSFMGNMTKASCRI